MRSQMGALKAATAANLLLESLENAASKTVLQRSALGRGTKLLNSGEHWREWDAGTQAELLKLLAIAGKRLRPLKT